MIARTDTRIRTRVRTAAASLAATALVAAMIVPGTALAATTPTTWKVSVGAQNRNAGNQANFFFTRKVTIDAGDSVKWTSDAEEIHTVSFLGQEARPDLAIPNGQGGIMGNPKVLAPSDPPGSVQTYDGSTFRNSGIMVPGAPTSPYTLSFPTPGVYTYFCLVHSQMIGTVEVQQKGAPLPRTQASYDREAGIARPLALAEATVNAARGTAAGAAPNKVTAGIGQLFTGLGSVAVLRFQPDRKVTRVGQAVTWTNLDRRNAAHGHV